MLTLWTIGYERLLPPALVAELQAAGVERVIDILNAELNLTMRQCGTPTLAQITKAHVRRV